MKLYPIRFALVPLLLILELALHSNSAAAQILRRPLIRRDQANAMSSDAITGPILGAGYATFELPANANLSLFTNREFVLSEAKGRVLYAVYDHQPVKAALRDVLGLNQTLLGQPLKVKIHFLFQGNEPLQLTLLAGNPLTQTIAVRTATPPEYELNLHDWWEEYNRATRASFQNDEYPQAVDLYLSLMLGRRLNLEVPREPQWRSLFNGSNDINQILGVLLGAESVRLALQKERWLQDAKQGQVADQPLPPAVQPPPIQYPPPAADVAIEPIALRVPHECLYVRFGSFENFRWFQKTLDEWGGDLRNLIAFRGVDYGLNEKLQQQLVLRESALAGLLGPAVIADVAMIGQDTFLREGAAIGFLFQAKNNFALSTDFKSQRSEALKKNRDALEQTLDIGGKKVSFIQTPDNRIRTFYVQDGDYHLITTSRHIVERFLETGTGQAALGSSVEYRSARTRMPLSRDDTITAYLSDEFFRTLTAPAYRIEMTRRMQSITEFDEWELAKWAARHEGVADLDPANLIKLGFLPPTFNQRPDGSQLLLAANNQLSDSLRGGKGSFIPVPDVKLERVTKSEVTAYQQFAQEYTQLWTRMDPVLVGIKRFALPAAGPNAEQRERLVMDVYIAPVVQRTSGFMQQLLAPPDQIAAHPLPEDLVLLQFVANDINFFGNGGRGQPNHYAIGLRNAPVAWNFNPQWNTVGPQRPQDAKLYLTAWPAPGLLKFLGATETPQFDAEGFQCLQNGILGQEQLWQRNRNTLSAVSWDRDLLRDVATRFPIGEAERPAQLRLHIGDVANSKMRDMANAMGYFRARQVSAGNLHFLHQLVQQLGVPIEDAKRVAESLIQGKLVDPLQGQYEAVFDQGLPRWRSTAWNADTSKLMARVPPDFVSPPFGWFRGLSAEVSILPTEYNGHIEIEMKRQVIPAATAAPEKESALPQFKWPSFKLKEGGPLPVPNEPATPVPPPEDIPPPGKRVPPPPPKPE